MGRGAWRIIVLILWLTSHTALASPVSVALEGEGRHDGTENWVAAHQPSTSPGQRRTTAPRAGRARDEQTSAGNAQDLEAAIANYERGDYATAFTQFNYLANERGSPPSRRDAAYYQRLAKARYWLALLYENGQGVAQDYQQAAAWYRAASKSGNADAAFHLGVLYEHGRGVTPDFKQAFNQYAAAEARGHPHAAAALERLRHQFHHPDSGITRMSPFDAAVAAYDSRNYAWATEQFLVLAQAGQIDAQLYLGELYELNRGRPDEAIRWFRAAAEQGDAEGQYRLARIYRSDRLDREGRRAWTNYAEAVQWHRAAAEQGHPDAQMELGQAYREGQGVSKDQAEATRWYQTAHKTKGGVTQLIEPQCAVVADVAEFAAVYAACNRGDKEETFQQLTVLANQGDARAQDWLGHWLYQGLPGIQRRKMYIAATNHGYFQRAAQFIRKAAEQGNASAQYNLGVVYEHGMGVAVNPAEAARWYWAAAGRGVAQAQAALARLGQ